MISIPADTDRAPTPARWPATDAAVVLRHGDQEFHDQLGARDVWVWEHDGTFHMHYDAAGESGWLAALATSSDGVSWTKHGPVLPLGSPGERDSGSASYGTTYRDGDRWRMFYLGTRNVSDDGLRTPAFPYETLTATAPTPLGPWTKHPDVVPIAAAEGTWYSETASPGAVLRYGAEHLMLFSAATTDEFGRIWRTLGVARTDDLDRGWVVDPEPLLPLTEQVENSSLFFDATSQLWYLFTNHIAVDADATPVPPQDTCEYTDAVWMYWADTPTGFVSEQKVVVIDSENAPWSPKVIGLPSVVRIGDRLAIYHDGSERDDISHGHRDVGVAWLDLPLHAPEV